MTYEELLKNPVAGQFSQHDLDLAKKYPEFGTSMVSLKEQYAKASTPEQKALINSQANALRQSFGNYSGGSDGSAYISGGISPASYSSAYQGNISGTLGQMSNYPGSYNNQYQGNISGLLGQMESYPTSYNNQYADQANALLNEVTNRPEFSYNKDADPSWSAYAKQYRREGARASENALGQAAVMTGGLPSSAAVTAASQAGDYYASQLSDKIPELYRDAYNRYVQEFTMDRAALSDVNTQEQLDYNKWSNQYNMMSNNLGAYQTQDQNDYNKWSNQYEMMSNNLGAYQNQDNAEYARTLDQVNFSGAQKQTAQSQVDAILAAGGNPSADLVAQSGYSPEYIAAMRAAYSQQLTRGGGGGGTQAQRDTSSDAQYELNDRIAKEAADYFAANPSASADYNLEKYLTSKGYDKVERQLFLQYFAYYKGTEVDVTPPGGGGGSGKMIANRMTK